MTKEKDVTVNDFLSGDQKKSETVEKQSTDNTIGESRVDTALDADNASSEQTLPDEVGAYTSHSPLSEATVPGIPIAGSRIVAETQPTADSDPIRRTVKQRKSDLSEYRTTFLSIPKIIDRKPVFVSRSTRDRLDRIVRLLGERGMSVSWLIENIALRHLDIHEADIEHWRKM